MKVFLVTFSLLSIPVIAWLPARFWTMCGDPWCIKFYPDWLDNFIIRTSLPYLSPDMFIAESQISFLQVWIASVIIMETFLIITIFLFRHKMSD